MQTHAYPQSVARALKRGLSSMVMVYLTVDGRPVANEQAITTSYAHFVSVLTATLDEQSIPEETRYAFKMLLTHLMYYAVPETMNVERSFESVVNLGSELRSAPATVRGLGDVMSLLQLLLREGMK